MDQVQVQRNTVSTLMIGNVFGAGAFVAYAAVVALLARNMLDSDTFAGWPSAAGTIGTALLAAPLALASRRRGRRRGIMLGYLAAFVGGLVGFAAGQFSLFWLLLVTGFLFGVGQAANLQSRFAAADLAADDTRARDISLVVWVATVGGIVGPPLALWVNQVGMNAGLVEWATPMLLGSILFAVGAFIIATRLRPDPLELAGGIDPHAKGENPYSGIGPSFRAVWGRPMARLALFAMAISQMAMVSVMTMTPLHMRDHDQAELSTIVIAVHVVGMFGLAPLIGRWADRYGRVRTIQVGAVILGIGTVSSVVAGYVPALIFVGLFLLGVGWNFSLVAGSALLTESLPASERVGAQGLSDFAMASLGAIAAISSGFIKAGAGFHWLANFATIAAVLLLAAAVYVERSQPRVSASV